VKKPKLSSQVRAILSLLGWRIAVENHTWVVYPYDQKSKVLGSLTDVVEAMNALGWVRSLGGTVHEEGYPPYSQEFDRKACIHRIRYVLSLSDILPLERSVAFVLSGVDAGTVRDMVTSGIDDELIISTLG